jgi:tetratricopeptide (TPR) repeat protein
MAAKKKSVNPKAALIRAEKLSDEARDALANGEIKEGVKLYEEAIAADPTFEWAYYGLAEELGRQGRVDEQIKLLNSGLAKIKSASLYDSLGAAYQRIEDLEKAVTCFKNAIDIDSNAHYSYANLGAAYIQGGQFEAAEQAYDRALQILPGYHFALAGLGSLAEKRGSLAEAIRFYERAARRCCWPLGSRPASS